MGTQRRTCIGCSLGTGLKAFLLILLCSLGAIAQEPGPALSEAIPLEVYREPEIKRNKLPQYPTSEIYQGKDGWVFVNLMVSPEGKPYELTVAESSGNKAFEKSALEAVSRWTYEPATLQGKPVDSASTVKITFRLSDKPGASSAFITAYKAAVKAVQSKDRSAADAAMNTMSAQNLYEHAYAGLAEYQYAVEWGTQAEQLSALSRAIAQENQAVFLPKAAYKAALRQIFPLQINQRHFKAALKTWERLQKVEDDSDTLAPYKALVDKILILQKDEASFSVSGNLKNSSWSHSLLKRNFHINVTSGHVAQLKLRCQRQYVSFAFDPELQYRVADGAGDCWLEVIGDPDTAFDLVQS